MGCRTKPLLSAGLLAAALLSGGVGVARAQSLEPRAYSPAPTGLNFVIAGYAYTEGGLSFDTAVPITDARLSTSGPIVAYARTLDIAGLSGKVDVILPFARLSGSALYQGQPGIAGTSNSSSQEGLPPSRHAPPVRPPDADELRLVSPKFTGGAPRGLRRVIVIAAGDDWIVAYISTGQFSIAMRSRRSTPRGSGACWIRSAVVPSRARSVGVDVRSPRRLIPFRNCASLGSCSHKGKSMQIMAVLAVLGATLGQPDPRDEDRPAVEEQQEQQADTESPPPAQQQAEPPEAAAESRRADEQPAEQQQPDADPSAAAEQPGEAGSDDASAELDEASGAAHWPELADRLVERYTSESGRTVGPYNILDVQRRQPALVLDVAIRSQFWPTQVEENVIRWMCDRQLEMFTNYAGGVLIVNLHDPAGQSQTVTITRCLRVPELQGHNI